MKRKLLLFSCLISSSVFSLAQNGKAFAITSDGNGDFMWMNIRQIDLNTGDVSKNIYERTATNFQFLDATTKKPVEGNFMKVQFPGPNNTTHLERVNLNTTSPTATMVAATAYDKKHDKLFFTPMRIGELRWLDLSSKADNPKFYTIQTDLLNSADLNDEANHITRMVINANGNGYAITNDANHLIQFTTGKKTVITDLGSLIDAESNNYISIHNKCSSWGGDVVADAFGKLYVFTASHNVFKVDVDTKIATYLGSVTGVSGKYTVNGAAVIDDNNVVISSANTSEGFYKVNMKDLTATKLATTGKVYNASDLANENLLYASQAKNTFGAAELKRSEIIGNSLIGIYPNPVTGSQFKVSFENNLPGEYNIALTDLQGRLLMSKQVTVKSANQVENIQLKTKPASGMYMIKVTDGNKKNIFSDKIVVQ